MPKSVRIFCIFGKLSQPLGSRMGPEVPLWGRQWKNKNRLFKTNPTCIHLGPWRCALETLRKTSECHAPILIQNICFLEVAMRLADSALRTSEVAMRLAESTLGLHGFLGELSGKSIIWICTFANPNYVTRIDEYALCAPTQAISIDIAPAKLILYL